jgi:putative chitinase
MQSSSFGEALTRLWPHGDEKIPGLRAGMIASAPSILSRYGVTTPLLVAHVMGQFSLECGCGHEVVENGNYSAVRMTQVWPHRFPTVESARPYAGNAQALFNKVYNGRMGNAVGSNDGYFYRGRGASQCTGREGYTKLGKATGLDLVNNPDLINAPENFLLCAVADWIICGCLPFAKADDTVGETKKLNGGTVGLADRVTWIAKWKTALAQLGNLPLFDPFRPVAVPTPATPIAAPAAAPVTAKPPVAIASSAAPASKQPSLANPAPGSIGAWIVSLFTRK